MPKFSTNERSSLLTNGSAATLPVKKNNFTEILGLVNAIPNGMAKTYSTFGPLAIMYYPGLWLIAPVTMGGLVSLSDEAFKHLARYYPDNELIKFMAQTAKSANHNVVGFFGDFGFNMGLITTIGVRFGGIKYYTNDFARIISPLTSLILSVTLTWSRGLRGQAHALSVSLPRRVVVTGLDTIHAANAPTLVLSLLQQQSILGETSSIPFGVIISSGIIGLLAGIMKNSHPKTNQILNSLIQVFLENPSLAVAFFAFPNDIFAAANSDEIPETFFYSMAGLSAIYLLILTLSSCMMANHKLNELSEAEELNGSSTKDSSCNNGEFGDVERQLTSPLVPSGLSASQRSSPLAPSSQKSSYSPTFFDTLPRSHSMADLSSQSTNGAQRRLSWG